MAVVTGMDESQLRAMVSRYCDFPSEGYECNPLLSLLPGPLDEGLQIILHSVYPSHFYVNFTFC